MISFGHVEAGQVLEPLFQLGNVRHAALLSESDI